MYYSLSRIEQLSAGDSDFLDKMIKVFIEETPIQVKQMKDLLDENNFYRLGRLAHKMKPTIDMFDMRDLKTLIRELEDESKKEVVEASVFTEKVNFAINRLNLIINDVKVKYGN